MYSERVDNGNGIWGRTVKLRVRSKQDYEKGKQQREWLANLPHQSCMQQMEEDAHKTFPPHDRPREVCWAEAPLSWTSPRSGCFLPWKCLPRQTSCFCCYLWVCSIFCFNTRTWDSFWTPIRLHCLMMTDRYTRQKRVLEHGHLINADVIEFILLLFLIQNLSPAWPWT